MIQKLKKTLRNKNNPMTSEEKVALVKFVENKLLRFNLEPLLVSISGSHAYGTNIEGSDVDIRGVYLQPTKDLLGLTGYKPQVSDETNDTTFYELGRFLELAQKGNPNIMEMLNLPEEQILYKSELFSQTFTEEARTKFITTKLKHTFSGFAHSQIKKARGLNKKIAWEEHRTVRKGPLDFCYVLVGRENSVKFDQWLDKDLGNKVVREYSQVFGKLGEKDIGLAKVNNAPDLYSMYLYKGQGGIVDEDSNSVQLRSMPIGSPFIGYLRFDLNAYSTHCADYKSYQEWLTNRNKLRYENSQQHGKGYDGKNLLHTFRLLETARDIASGKGIVVKRPEAEFLLDVRNGVFEYEELLQKAEDNMEELKELFDSANLPREVSMRWINELLTNIRLMSYER